LNERDDLYLAYAAGLLPPAPSLVIASHAALNGEARKEIGDYEAIAGALLEEMAPSEVAEDLRGSVMQKLDLDTPETVTVSEGDPRLPGPLRGYVGARLEDLRWRRLLPGLRDCVLPIGGGGIVRLLSVRGGAKVPAHTHPGLEMTLVLRGSYSDDTGCYGLGDLQLADDELDHSPVPDPEAGCLCLLVTHRGPIRLTGRYMRVLNAFMRH